MGRWGPSSNELLLPISLRVSAITPITLASKSPSGGLLQLFLISHTSLLQQTASFPKRVTPSNIHPMKSLHPHFSNSSHTNLIGKPRTIQYPFLIRKKCHPSVTFVQ